MTGSNRRPSACKADALPAELITHRLARRAIYAEAPPKSTPCLKFFSESFCTPPTAPSMAASAQGKTVPSQRSPITTGDHQAGARRCPGHRKVHSATDAQGQPRRHLPFIRAVEAGLLDAHALGLEAGEPAQQASEAGGLQAHLHLPRASLSRRSTDNPCSAALAVTSPCRRSGSTPAALPGWIGLAVPAAAYRHAAHAAVRNTRGH